MGKRCLIIIIAALLLMPQAFAAITVTLSTPASPYTSSSSTVSFVCTASDDNPENSIASVDLYIGTASTWHKNKTSAGSPLSVTVDGIPNGAYEWNCNATNNLGAGAFASSNSSLTVSVVSNYAPNFTGTVPNQTFNEDSTLSNAFDLDTYFQDTVTLAYSSSGNSHITVSIADGQVTFSSTANWSGSELIRFTANDGSLANTSNYINVTVLPVNDAPYYSAIPTQNMTKNTNHTINLNDYFHDVEGTTLIYNVSTKPSHMNYTISSNTVTLAPEANWAGTTTISFTASDGNATTTSNTVTLNVSGGNATGNRAPRISCSPTFDRVSAGAGEEKTFRITAKSDPDGDTLSVVWKIGGEAIEGETGDSYTFSKDTAGTYTVAAAASDGSLDAECSWAVTVSAVAESNFSGAVDVESIIEEQTEEIARCGDSRIQEGETCSNCPDDVKCAENETCQNNVCVPKAGLKIALIIIGMALAVILIGGFIAYKLSMRRKVGTRVRDGRNLSKVDKERPSTDLHDIYEMEESRKPGIAGAPSPEESPLKQYVSEMRKKGVSDEEIAQALKSRGWGELLVKHALKK